MVTHDEAVALITSLPEVEEYTSYGNRAWRVKGKMFVWDRPLRKADVKRWSDGPVPDGPILGLKVEDLGEKEAVLAAGTPGLFTIAHFDGYPSILAQLDVVSFDDLRDAILDAWLASAPEQLAAEYLRDQPVDER
jgi:hypothetical protein